MPNILPQEQDDKTPPINSLEKRAFHSKKKKVHEELSHLLPMTKKIAFSYLILIAFALISFPLLGQKSKSNISKKGPNNRKIKVCEVN